MADITCLHCSSGELDAIKAARQALEAQLQAESQDKKALAARLSETERNRLTMEHKVNIGPASSRPLKHSCENEVSSTKL